MATGYAVCLALKVAFKSLLALFQTLGDLVGTYFNLFALMLTSITILKAACHLSMTKVATF